MSNQSDNTENKAETKSEVVSEDTSEDKSETESGGCRDAFKGLLVIVILSSIIAFFTYDSDDRTLSYDNALNCMLSSKEQVYYQLNREGAVITEFPRDWDSWNFDHNHIATYERGDNTIVEYRLEYYVPFILAGAKLETDVILDVVHNERTDKWTIRKVRVPEFNKLMGQIRRR